MSIDIERQNDRVAVAAVLSEVLLGVTRDRTMGDGSRRIVLKSAHGELVAMVYQDQRAPRKYRVLVSPRCWIK